jgi:hypothetical protein
MEEEFWMLHGEPKFLKPYIIKSHADPNHFRKSWIYLKYKKDLELIEDYE